MALAPGLPTGVALAAGPAVGVALPVGLAPGRAVGVAPGAGAVVAAAPLPTLALTGRPLRPVRCGSPRGRRRPRRRGRGGPSLTAVALLAGCLRVAGATSGPVVGGRGTPGAAVVVAGDRGLGDRGARGRRRLRVVTARAAVLGRGGPALAGAARGPARRRAGAPAQGPAVVLVVVGAADRAPEPAGAAVTAGAARTFSTVVVAAVSTAGATGCAGAGARPRPTRSGTVRTTSGVDGSCGSTRSPARGVSTSPGLTGAEACSRAPSRSRPTPSRTAARFCPTMRATRHSTARKATSGRRCSASMTLPPMVRPGVDVGRDVVASDYGQIRPTLALVYQTRAVV